MENFKRWWRAFIMAFQLNFKLVVPYIWRNIFSHHRGFTSSVLYTLLLIVHTIFYLLPVLCVTVHILKHNGQFERVENILNQGVQNEK